MPKNHNSRKLKKLLFVSNVGNWLNYKMTERGRRVFNRSNASCFYIMLFYQKKKVFDRVKWKSRNDLEHDNLECIWIEIFEKNAKSFLVRTMYQTPVQSKYLPKDFERYLNNMLLIATSESKEINLLGDLNVNYHKKCDHKEIKEIFKLYVLRQIVTKETRITETCRTLIDCILPSRNDCTYESEVFPTSISDHDVVGFIRKVKER